MTTSYELNGKYKKVGILLLLLSVRIFAFIFVMYYVKDKYASLSKKKKKFSFQSYPPTIDSLEMICSCFEYMYYIYINIHSYWLLERYWDVD